MVGLIVDLSYTNPYLSPFDEFQRFKHHPVIAQYLEGGKRIAYGARAITKGGFNSLPKMVFPGGALIGCDLGTMNFSKIKGSHTAMKSGMLAAEAVARRCWPAAPAATTLATYPRGIQGELAVRRAVPQPQFRPAAAQVRRDDRRRASTGSSRTLFGGKLPFTVHDLKPDHADAEARRRNRRRSSTASRTASCRFDKLSSVFLSSTNHEEDQPVHLKLTDPTIPIAKNLPLYDEPAQRYCPAGVYEVVGEDGSQALPDQRAELRALQDLRHQGPGAEHHLGGARGRRRSELREYVTPQASSTRKRGSRNKQYRGSQMKVLVSVKRVIDFNVRIQVKPDGSGVVTDGVKHSMNPFDEIAMEEAVRLKEKGKVTEIIAVTIGGAKGEETLRTALAFGADRAIHVKEEGEVQPLTAARALAAVFKKEDAGPVSARQAGDRRRQQPDRPDAGGAARPARRRRSPPRSKSTGNKAKVTREVDAGLETLEVDLPAVVTTDLRLNEPRYLKLPDIMKAKKKPIETVSLADLGVQAAPAVKVVKTASPPTRSKGVMVKTVDELVAALKAKGLVS